MLTNATDHLTSSLQELGTKLMGVVIAGLISIFTALVAAVIAYVQNGSKILAQKDRQHVEIRALKESANRNFEENLALKKTPKSNSMSSM